MVEIAWGGTSYNKRRSFLALATPPSAAGQAGVAITQAPVLQLRDAKGLPVSRANILITARAVPAATVTLVPAQLTTDRSGTATCTSLAVTGPAGSYTLWFEASGVTGVSSALSLSAAPPSPIGAVLLPAAASVAVAGRTPTLVPAGLARLQPAAAGVSVTAITPAIGSPTTLFPAAAIVAVTGITPTLLGTGVRAVTPTAASVAVTGVTPVLIAATGVNVSPGQSIQAAVDANPAGTTFNLLAGTHTNQTVIPKAGNIFIGQAGTILDGGGVTTYAFRRAGTMPNGPDVGPDNVTIRGASITDKMVIRNYAPPFQYGCIIAGGDGSGDGTDGWVCEFLDIRDTVSGGAIRLGHTMTVRNCLIFRNNAIGLVGISNNGLIEDNEISFNNSIAMSPPGNEHGGTKFVACNGLTVRGNFVHHNHGPGLWTDIDNVNVLYEDNICEDNFGEGIVHEISYAATIRNNECRRNGLTDPRGDSWLWGAGIGVHSSPNVEVYGNIVSGNRHAIALIQQARGTGSLGAYVVSNCSVHDNTVTFSNANQRHGAVDDTAVPTIWSSGNTFEDNDYFHAGTGANHYDWSGGPPESSTAWVAYGHDNTGSFTP